MKTSDLDNVVEVLFARLEAWARRKDAIRVERRKLAPFDTCTLVCFE